MKEIGSYPKIVSILDEKIRDIFGKEVIITEKIDGSQFGFGIVENQLYYRSKSVDLSGRIDSAGMFSEAIKVVQNKEGIIREFYAPEIVLYAEYLKKPKHNVLCYSKYPLNHLALFGGFIIQNGLLRYLTRGEIEYFATVVDMDVVPVLYRGGLRDIKLLDKLLDTESYLGGSKIEGLVIECRDYVPERMPWMPFALAKYVSERFKEKHQVNRLSENKSLDFMLEKCYVTETRFEKAYQHLRDDGLIENSVTDIGALIKEVRLDFESEEGQEAEQMIADFYIEKHMRKLVKQVSRGVPDWYKAKLKEMINDNGNML